MAKVLYITANPLTEDQSFGLAVGRAFLNSYKEQNPQDEIVELDLFKANVPLIDGDVLSGWGALRAGTAFTDLPASAQEKIGTLGALCDQFLEFDKYVFVTPMWNFTVPAQMKAYIDAICVAGKTFKYTENGPVGLLNGKPAIHIQARGGYYSEGPAAVVEMGDRYLQAVFQFIGLKAYDSIIIEGHAFAPDQAEAIKATAIENAKEAAKKFAAEKVVTA